MVKVPVSIGLEEELYEKLKRFGISPSQIMENIGKPLIKNEIMRTILLRVITYIYLLFTLFVVLFGFAEYGFDFILKYVEPKYASVLIVVITLLFVFSMSVCFLELRKNLIIFLSEKKIKKLIKEKKES